MGGLAAAPQWPGAREEARACEDLLGADLHVLPNPFAIWISSAVPGLDRDLARGVVAVLPPAIVEPARTMTVSVARTVPARMAAMMVGMGRGL